MKFDLGQFKNGIDILMILTTLVLTYFGFQSHEALVQLIIFGVILLLIVLYVSYVIIRSYNEYRIENKSMTNSSVVKRVRKYCDSLYEFSKAIRKKVYKNKEFVTINKMYLQEKKIIKKIHHSKTTEKQKEILTIKLKKLKTNFTNKNALSVISHLDTTQDFIIVDLLVDIFSELERPLLNAEQFSLRVKFGNFIKDFSKDENKRQKAYIDFLGWSYIMLGRTKKGLEAIHQGIESAKVTLEETNNEKLKQECIYNIARAYRHLGSARERYEKKPLEAKKDLEKAKEYLFKLDPSFKGYTEMEVGIDYGLIMTNYFIFVNKTKTTRLTSTHKDNLDESFANINDLINVAHSFSNKHRYVKLLLLKAKYLNQLLLHQEDNPKLNEINEVKDVLRKVEIIFKDNIFTDEAVEFYLEESVNRFKHELLIALEDKGA